MNGDWECTAEAGTFDVIVYSRAFHLFKHGTALAHEAAFAVDIVHHDGRPGCEVLMLTLDDLLLFLRETQPVVLALGVAPAEDMARLHALIGRALGPVLH